MFLWTDMSLHLRTGYLVVGLEGRCKIQLTVSTGTFPVSHLLLVWFGNLERCVTPFRPQGLQFSVLQHWFTEGHKCSSQDSLWLVRITGSQRELGAQLCVFRIYAELYRDRMLNKYFNRIWESILIKENITKYTAS